MMRENNLIELKNYRMGEYVCNFPEPDARCGKRLLEILKAIAAVTEILVSGAIGFGFMTCVVLVFTML